MAFLIIGVFYLVLNVPWIEGVFRQAENWILGTVEHFWESLI